MHLPCLTSVWRQQIEEESNEHSRVMVVEEEEEACEHGRMAVVKEEACMHNRAVAAEEEASSTGVDDGGGDQWSRERAAGT
jgi:hypothetical protein